MKKIIPFIFVFSFLLSCEKGSVTFYIEEEEIITVESSFPVSLPYSISIGTISNTSSVEYENNNTAPDLIQEVLLDNITLSIITHSGEDFSFLESMNVYIKKTDATDKILLAYIDNIDPNATSIELTPVENINLVPILQQDSYILDTEVEIKEYSLHDIDINLFVKFKITAGVL